ncbi:hypothetical protein M3O96_00045 [Aquiflexum sp. TKW24L]|uniref:tetratricopeptide repeat-containing protein n=1 Tax=Aquiflexum sp. TKW24L TaxID=2942212 RepID=UPI0020C092B8|nr:tetratricopeptide repeat-containing protein [Aquiflexum sp. TKW24L]MCL6257459.1 hypothetical protein [Aquiflexum sp. TKW24L]
MDVFIVRPFNTKIIRQKDLASDKIFENKINFDEVEKILIQPVLTELNLRGGTTGEIFEAGEIREDMFSLLLLADIVIADITIHNANVFYELGVRHALRKNKTILLKSQNIDTIPFDILGYRYVSYDYQNPSNAINDLRESIKATIDSDRTDSPVFNMLPKLNSQDPEDFLAIPLDFSEEVEIACAEKQIGKLSLLVSELDGLPWKIPGLRKIGNDQFKLKAFKEAKSAFEDIRKRNPDDYEANDRLATIYQRLSEEEKQKDKKTGLLKYSDLAIERVLKNPSKLTAEKLAEIYSLKARNAKTRWIGNWINASEKPQEMALLSPELESAIEDYERGFESDLNHFYSGINALSLLTIKIGLAENHPHVWELQFDEEDDAEKAISQLRKKLQKLTVMVEGSIDAAKNSKKRKGEIDPWLEMTEADFLFLSSKNMERVRNKYKGVLTRANNLNFDSARRQILIFQKLGVLTDNAEAALSEFGETTVEFKKQMAVIFTGHMVDNPNRKTPRFPAEKEAVARENIKAMLQNEIENFEGEIIGIAGGACGGDILFHEICQELAIKSELYLPMSREKFLEQSVRFAGNNWVKRFDNLYQTLDVRYLSESGELPRWLKNKSEYSIWERNNSWILYSGLAKGGINSTLIALWDEKEGDGPGGTKHLVTIAQKNGAKIEIIATNKIFGLE